MNKRLAGQSIPILLALVLLWYVLKDVPFGELVGQFRKANIWRLAVVGLVVVMYMLARAVRWRLVLQAVGHNPTVFRTLVAMMAGQLASMIVPGAGELTRCGTLQRTDGIPLSRSVGSVVGERVIDSAVLLLTLLLSVVVEFTRMKAYLSDLTVALPSGLVLGAALVVLLSGGLVGWWLFTTHRIRRHPSMQKLRSAARGFREGFLAIRHLPNPALFMGLTVCNQLLAWLSTQLLLSAFDATRHLPLSAALTILTVSSLGGLAVPTQGGIGTYHFFVSRALILYGFSASAGATAATFLHAVGFGYNLLLSSTSFLILPFLIRRQVPSPPVRTNK